MSKDEKQLLILDLDDTIFETKTIGKSNFSKIIDLIENTLKNKKDEKTLNQLIEALWHRPFDVIMERFAVNQEDRSHIASQIGKLEYNLQIETYRDYFYLKSIGIEQILVTTGFPKLQLSKVRALGIQDDFNEIFIDDITGKNRIHKKGIFQKILKKSKKLPEQIWVIGDNPDSEIRAGKELGLRTIQRLREKTIKSEYAEFSIYSFKELQNIIYNSH